MADAVGTVVTSTIDRLAYSPSPPIVFAVVDFDGGGRYPVELTDTDADEIRAGSRVEMTFRRLFSADGIHDYFWKAPVPSAHGRRQLMSSHGVRDKVAIVGMGCTQFAELWEKGLDDLIVDASTEAFESAGVGKEDVDAYWFGTAQSGMSGITLARPLQLHNKPVTRVENYCTTGSEALRGAVYAVASGAYDVAMAVGAEKVKDSGYQGLNAMNPPGDGTARTLTAAAMFSMVAPAYAEKYGVDDDVMADVLASIAVKNHYNGARNPRAQFRKEITKEAVLASPRLAGTLGVFDCAGVADGAAAAIVVRAEDAHRYTDKPRLHQGTLLRGGQRVRPHRPGLRLHPLPRVRGGGGRRLRPGRHYRPPAPARHGRGARLLHPDRVGADGGPRLRPAGHGLEGSSRRHVQPRRRPAGEPRRRVEELRSPGGGLGSAHVLRMLAAAAGRGAA